MSGLYGNAILSPVSLKTVMLVDENENEIAMGVVVGQETIFTATDNDVRVGSVYASDNGVSTGTKVIPSYHTTEGTKLIAAGSQMSFVLSTEDAYDYTKLQAIICIYNSSISNSVAAEKVVINDNVYSANSTTVLSTISKDSSTKSINLGITNTGSTPCIIRYITYKEIE